MRREQRLRRAADFSGVYRRGRAWSHPLLVVKSLPNRLPLSRFGFAVGKKIGKAVVRNRIKRRLREAVRSLPLESGWDTVIIAKAPAAQADFGALQAALRDAFRRAKLLRPLPPPARDAVPAGAAARPGASQEAGR